jgi:hypothetical protein
MAGHDDREIVRQPHWDQLWSGTVRTTVEVGWSLSVGSFAFFTIISS